VKTKVLLLAVIWLFIFSAFASADTGQNYFKFQISSHDDVYKLTNLISIDNVDGLTVYAYATDQQFAYFRTLGYKYEVLPSPGSLINPQMSSTVEGVITDWDTYPTYQAYLDMMNQFATTYPNLCQIVNIGTTVQGRQLLFAKLSANVTAQENEPEVAYSSSMHGDEATGYILMLRLIDYLLTNYGTNPQITRLLDSTEVWINPLANPDGTYHGGNNSVNGAWRYNANSVDLNRNFPDPAAGAHPDGNSWQPETVAMMNFATAHSFVISANFHGGAEVVNYPWDTWSRLHADNTWFFNISRAYADSVHAYSPSGYMDDLNNGITNGYAWYRVTGGRQDYMTYFKGDREVTIEISATKLLPANQLPAHWDYNRVSFLNYLENSLYGIRGTVTDASNGAPLPAMVTVVSHDIDSARVFTDPDVGDYHRMLANGTYNLSFASPGYTTQTINGISVTNRHATYQNVQLQAVSILPDLTYLSNNAGDPDPGDTVSMHITLRNDGGGVAQNAIGIISSLDPYITITQNSSGYPNITPANTGLSLAAYNFIISASCPAYRQVNFRLGLTANGGYIDSAFFSIIVGRQIEDFESGGFTSFPWQMGGTASWVTTTSAPSEGLYSARSGVITHYESSELSVAADVAAAGTITFYYKVSSEVNYDYLRFYIDSNLQNQWSGEIGWTQASFGVSAGSHTFKWGYYKDQGYSSGSDCGWIDYIVFPQTTAPLIEITTDSLPDWTANHFYSQQLTAIGGSGTLTWYDPLDGLDGTGLTLSTGGLVSGVPIAVNQISFTARVEDQIGGSDERPFEFTVNPILAITTLTLPNGVVGQIYSIQLQATGGTGVRGWSDRDNDLIGSGLSLSGNGLLEGIPSTFGSINFTALVTDIIADSSSHDYSFDITRGSSYVPGDVNNSGQANGLDVVFLVNYFKGGTSPQYTMDCPPHGVISPACDVNGSCSVNGLDVTFLVSFFKGGETLRFCADCPPGGGLLWHPISGEKVSGEQ
jgi:hypothetical protein